MIYLTNKCCSSVYFIVQLNMFLLVRLTFIAMFYIINSFIPYAGAKFYLSQISKKNYDLNRHSILLCSQAKSLKDYYCF